MSGDENAILRAYLLAQSGLQAVVSDRIYCPRLPEGNALVLPALAFFSRGGESNPFNPESTGNSFQCDCWGTSNVQARQVYRALRTILRGIGGYYNSYMPVILGGSTYYIWESREEMPGQDLQDVSVPNYYKVLAFFRIKIQIE